jgi:hypothetical protein
MDLDETPGRAARPSRRLDTAVDGCAPTPANPEGRTGRVAKEAAAIASHRVVTSCADARIFTVDREHVNYRKW